MHIIKPANSKYLSLNLKCIQIGKNIIKINSLWKSHLMNTWLCMLHNLCWFCIHYDVIHVYGKPYILLKICVREVK